MPYYVPRTKFRKVQQPAFRNRYWENWGPLSKYIGMALVLCGIGLSVIEIVRILYGPTNRGVSNYNSNGNNNFPINTPNLLFKIGNGNVPLRVEKFHYWPWTYAANLFGLIVMAAGGAGIISAHRRSYSSLFAFLTLCLFAALLSGFLIGYYSILVNYYISVGLNNSSTSPDTFITGWGLIATNLAFSCLSCLMSVIGLILAFLGVRGCTPKGMQIDELNNKSILYSQIPPVNNSQIKTVNVPSQIVNSVVQPTTQIRNSRYY